MPRSGFVLGEMPDHAQFVAALRAQHGRKQGFWQLVAR